MVTCKYCGCRFAYDNGVCHECEHHENVPCVNVLTDESGGKND